MGSEDRDASPTHRGYAALMRSPICSTSTPPVHRRRGAVFRPHLFGPHPGGLEDRGCLRGFEGFEDGPLKIEGFEVRGSRTVSLVPSGFQASRR
eukprot:2871103-Pyramimonas_sp.AAC.1